LSSAGSWPLHTATGRTGSTEEAGRRTADEEGHLRGQHGKSQLVFKGLSAMQTALSLFL
jgi:hypothetical protein